MDNNFKVLELEYKENPIKNGEYIDISDKLLDKRNYIFNINGIVSGIYIYEFFNKDIDFNKIINTFKKYSKMYNNRGDYAGIVDKTKLYPSYHKYINENTKYNKYKTRVDKSSTCKYAFSNGCKYMVLNKDKTHYKNNKKELELLLNKDIIKPINKELKHFFDVNNNNNIFGFWNELIFNCNTRSAIHSDINNKDDLSCLCSLSTDTEKLPYTNLNLPDFNISIPFKNNSSILIMNLKHIRHSNDIIKEDLLKYRYSFVLYNK